MIATSPTLGFQTPNPREEVKKDPKKLTEKAKPQQVFRRPVHITTKPQANEFFWPQKNETQVQTRWTPTSYK